MWLFVCYLWNIQEWLKREFRMSNPYVDRWFLLVPKLDQDTDKLINRVMKEIAESSEVQQLIEVNWF